MSKKRVLICGAGAAGLTAAIFSAEKGADVTLLDLFGRIGGFNFYWAWVTGRLAGLNASGSDA